MTEPKSSPTRREFLKTTSVVTAGTAALNLVPNAFAKGSDTIKVGVIGCGGRGRGAAENICNAAGTSYNVKLYALGDVFEDRVKDAHEHLKNSNVTKEK